MQKKELIFNVFGKIILTHLTTLSTFYLLKAPYKEPDFFFNYIRDPHFLNNFFWLLTYLSVQDLKQILTQIRQDFFEEILCNYRFFLKLIDPRWRLTIDF